MTLTIYLDSDKYILDDERRSSLLGALQRTACDTKKEYRHRVALDESPITGNPPNRFGLYLHAKSKWRVVAQKRITELGTKAASPDDEEFEIGLRPISSGMKGGAQ